MIYFPEGAFASGSKTTKIPILLRPSSTVAGKLRKLQEANQTAKRPN